MKKRIYVTGLFALILFTLWGSLQIDQYQWEQQVGRSVASQGALSGDFNCVELIRGLTDRRQSDRIRQAHYYELFEKAEKDSIPAYRAPIERPNHPIRWGLSQSTRFRQLFGETSYRRLLKLKEFDANPNVLMGAMETGTVSLGGKQVKIKIGGEAVVVDDMINNYLSFMRVRRPDARLSIAVPGYRGKGSFGATGSGEFFGKISIDTGIRDEEIKIFKYIDENGVEFYEFTHPIFDLRPAVAFDGVRRPVFSGGKLQYDEIVVDGVAKKVLKTEDVQINIYNPWGNHRIRKFYESIEGWESMTREQRIAFNNSISEEKLLRLWQTPATELFSGRVEWEALYFYSLYSRALGKLSNMLSSNSVHLHDYHTMMASFSVDPKVSVLATIHNGGYHGRFWTWGFGDGYRIKNTRYPEGIPYAGSKKTVDDYRTMLKIAGVNFDQSMKYLQAPDNSGDILLINAMNHVGTRNLVGGMPVSEGYASELQWTMEEYIGRVMREKGTPPASMRDYMLPNGGNDVFTKNVLDGVVNGLSTERHAANHSFLKKMGLNFGDNLDTPEGIAKVHRNKAILKKHVQETYGLKVDPDVPLVVSVARNVDQKDLGVFADNIEYLLRNGAQVLVGGPAGDSYGREVAARLQKIADLPSSKGRFTFVNGFANAAEIQSGADWFVGNPKFAPCELTDAEAAWFGTPSVQRITGGLIKTEKYSVGYLWTDGSDHWGHVMKQRQALDRALVMFREDPSSYYDLRIGGLQYSFPLDTQFSRFFENTRANYVYKAVEAAKNRTGVGNAAEVEIEVENYLREVLPEDLMDNYFRLKALKK